MVSAPAPTLVKTYAEKVIEVPVTKNIKKIVEVPVTTYVKKVVDEPVNTYVQKVVKEPVYVPACVPAC